MNNNDPDNYYFEREWRAINNIDFQLSDILTIVIPKEYELQLKEDFPEYTGKIEYSD